MPEAQVGFEASLAIHMPAESDDRNAWVQISEKACLGPAAREGEYFARMRRAKGKEHEGDLFGTVETVP